MAIGSGLGSQVGYSTESTWGTRVAPAKFARGTAYAANRAQNRVQGEGIQAGVLGNIGAHYVETTEAGEGSLSLDVQTNGMGPLLQALTGGTSTITQQAATAAWLQTHTLGDPLKSLTVQVGTPYRTGTVFVQELQGAKVTSGEFSCAADGILTGTFNFDAKKYDSSQTLATATYVATKPFHGKQMAVKTGTFGAEASVSGVKNVSLSWTNALDTEDYTAGSTGLKAEQIRNGVTTITGSLTVDWLTTTKTAFEDLRVANTSTSLVLKWTGALIASTYYEDIEIGLPGVFFTGDTPSVQGADVLTVDYGFEWKYDGTNLPYIKYTSTDATSIG
ncbi:MAG: phage tail tube protein [Candidatus Nanopelagicales bacterium]